MTSQRLTALLSGNQKILDTEIDVSPEDVYLAGTLAQIEILSRVPILERKGTLVLSSGITEYQYTPVTITDATTATPIVITAPSHGLADGDTIIIAGVSGLSGANGRFLAGYLTANTFSLKTLAGANVAGTGTYTSGGTVYHDLLSAYTIKKMRRLDSPYGEIEKESFTVVEEARKSFSTADIPNPSAADVVKFHEVFDTTLKLVFQGSPGGTIRTEIYYQRIPIEAEALSSSVDPIIPYIFDFLLLQGTKFYILNNINNEKAQQKADKENVKFETALIKAKRMMSRRRFIFRERMEGVNWE